MEYIVYERSRPVEVRRMIDEAPVAYVPLGALEWHGPQGPLGLDGLKARRLCERAAERTGGVVFPVMFWGAFDTMPFPYTFHFKKSNMKYLVGETLRQLDGMDFKVIVMLTGHYPPTQTSMLKKLCRRHNRDKRRNSLAIGAPEQFFAIELGYYGDHAGFWETSLMLAMAPEMVDLEALPGDMDSIRRMIKLGVMGRDPATATAEDGDKVIEVIVGGIAEVVGKALEDGDDRAFEEVYSRLSRKVRRSPLKVAYEAFDVRSVGELARYLWLTWRYVRRERGEELLRGPDAHAPIARGPED